jgi:lipoate-protein ligase A
VTDRPVRLLDLGEVSPLRSQALYLGLGESMDDASPDTIVLCRPAAPYFCVGHHQSPAEELDLDWCREAGYPVLQRRIGGGTVFLDSSQLFYQCIFHRRRAPLMVDAIYRRFLMPVVEALRALGLAATLEGVNEIEVEGRRIAGTGGGQIGEAVVVVGNVLLDFPGALMARAWRVPSPAFRRLAREGLRRYLTTLGRELRGRCATPAALADRIAGAYADRLGEPLVAGALTPREGEAVRAAEEQLGSGRFARGGGAAPYRGLKIARGVYVFEGRAAGAAVRVSLRLRHGLVDGLAVRGADSRRARALVGRPIATLAPAADAGNPADALGELLASGVPAA